MLPLPTYSISFDSPWYLLLLGLVPIFWWHSARRLGVLRPWRWWSALALRTVVMILLIFAVSGMQMVHTSDRLTVIYLLDQSLSIPAEQRRAMIGYVNAAIERHRKRDNRAGVIVFGRDAAIEIPPFDEDVKMPLLAESLLDPTHTNLAGAMRLAQASFPEGAARRIVVVSDGNENVGDAVEQARGLAAAGVGIDVVPIRFDRQGEVVLERIVIPCDIRRGEPFDLKIVATNTKTPEGGEAAEVSGRLIIRQRAGDQTRVLSDEVVVLPPGKRVYTIRQQIDAPSFYTYEAEFVPERPEDDTMRRNNRATAFTHVRGRGQVLLIESFQAAGRFERLAQTLRRRNLEMTVRPSHQAITGFADLQQFDAVVLANAPREHFTDEQIQMLVRNTQQMGAGLVMLGPNSFGAGGWNNTAVEQAMPVDFQIKTAKVVPRGALALVIDRSGSMAGGKLQMAKAAAMAAVDVLSPKDYVTVVAFDSEAHLIVPMTERGPASRPTKARIGRMGAGGGTHLHPAMVVAHQQMLLRDDAAVRHMIVLSDGRTTGSGYPQFVSRIRRDDITVTVVAIGNDADKNLLSRMATAGGGRFYQVTSPKVLPRIFQREARRVAQPLIFESRSGVRPEIRFPHEMLSGIEAPPPPIHGFVMTTRKENPLVEVSMISPQPENEPHATILASWTYGLGRAVALTTDCGTRWASTWTGWQNYDKLFGQIVAWSMRPLSNEGDFTVAAEVKGTEVHLVVTALDKNSEFLNFLDLSGTVLGPDLKPLWIKIQQTAPGRYEGTFPVGDSGSYFLTVNPGAGRAPIRTGVSIPYSDEFRTKTTNASLLEQLAQFVPDGGKAGELVPTPTDPGLIEPMLSVNSFRDDLPKATSSQDIWFHLVFLAGCLFFFDVLVRRVQLSFAWAPPLAGRVRDRTLRRTPEPPQPEVIQRLRSRKAAVGQQVDQLRGGARFEPREQMPATAAEMEELQEPPPASPAREQPSSLASPCEQESYTARLLKAKKETWQDRRETGQ